MYRSRIIYLIGEKCFVKLCCKLEVSDLKFNIIICEDAKSTITKIASLVLEYFEKTDYEFNYHQLQSNFQKVFEYAKNTDEFRNIYLLDIDLKENINGLNLAQKIREYDYLGYIIFITSHTELGMTALSYKLKILDFIDKANKNFKSRLCGCFETIITESSIIKNEDKHIMIKSGLDYFPIILNDIIFIETDSIGRKIIIHTLRRTIESYTPLKDIVKELDGRFFRCHRAAVVNTEKISKICTERGNTHLELSGENICPLSIRKVKELMYCVDRVT